MLNIDNNSQPIPPLDYVQHLERGYCANHPDVLSGAKTQVVDRAVKQLFELLRARKFEVWEDANSVVLMIGFTGVQGDPVGSLRMEKATKKIQYFDPDASAWKDFGSGGVSDHTLLQNIGVKTHAELDEHVSSTDAHWPTPQAYTPTDFDSHLGDTSAHNNPGGMEINANTTLTYTDVGPNRLIVVAGACQVSLPTGPDGMTCTIYVRNNIQVTVYFDAQWGGGGIRLPGSTTPVTLIKNSSAQAGNCITLRSMTMLDCWVVQSLIGTWAPV